ncbi:MAG: hypothetical protein V3W34_16500 [Phycisphaerae bacterium]
MTVCFLAVAFALVILWLRLWYATLVFDFGTGEWNRLRISEVWQVWHGDGPIGTAERGFFWSVAFFLSVQVLVPWLCFPRLHMGGTIWETYWETFRACLCCAGLAVVLAASVGGTFVVARHVLRGQFDGVIMNFGYGGAIMNFGFGMFTLCASYLLLSRIIGVVDSIRAPVPEHEPPPRCEGCGYDLTHQPQGGRCSECGFSVEDSLTSGRKRSGCAWENVGGPVAWLQTSVEVLLHTQRFYEKLPVRTSDDRARGFARWYYVLLGVLGSLCIFAGTSAGDGVFAVFGLPILILLLWPLVGWFALHGITALVIFWWVARGSTLRVHLTRKILSYEAAYLTVVGALFALLFASYIRYGDWITNTFGHEFFARSFKAPAETVAVVIGIALSTGIWLWRITLGIRAVRWSNF